MHLLSRKDSADPLSDTHASCIALSLRCLFSYLDIIDVKILQILIMSNVHSPSYSSSYINSNRNGSSQLLV